MTNKEIEIQRALGTLEPEFLSAKEFDHFVHLVTQRAERNIIMNVQENERLRAAGQFTEDSNTDD